MNILYVISCCLLSGLCVEASSSNKEEVEGGYVTFSCSFILAENNNKYFCKETCSGEDNLVETKGSRNETQGRYSIVDYGKGNVTVTIKDLKKSDSGTYRCGVERSIMDTYGKFYLTVTDALKPTVNPRPHVSTTLPNLSTTSNNPTTVPNLSAISPVLSITFLRSTNIHGLSSSGGVSLYSDGATHAESNGHSTLTLISIGLVVLVIVLVLVLILFYKKRRGSKRPKPLQPVFYNSNTAPCGETDCLYEVIREEDGQTETLPVIISSSSTTNPADTYCPQDDTYLNYSTVDFHKDHINPIYSPAYYPDTLVYSSVQQCKDSRTSLITPTASRTQDDSIYSTPLIF